MYTFIAQLLDLLYWGQVQSLLVFFALTWSAFLIKFARGRFFRPPPMEPSDFGASILVPVVDEKPDVWQEVLSSLRESCRGIDHQIVIISNGPAGIANADYARAQGFEVVHLEHADKRAAIARGARLARARARTRSASFATHSPPRTSEALRRCTALRIATA